MENLEELYAQYQIQIQETKNMAFGACKEYIDTIDLTFEGRVTNVDLLLSLDDLMEQLKLIVSSHLQNLHRALRTHHDAKYCFEQTIVQNLDRMWDGTIETVATKITRLSTINDKSVYQMLFFLEKSIKATIGKLFYQIRNCMDLQAPTTTTP